MPIIKSIHQNKGFTLVEISIVVTIIAIAAIAILITINPLAQIFKGYDARRKADLASLKIAFEDYYTDHDCYPSKEVLNTCDSDALAPYLKSIPCDPNDHTPYKITTIPDASACPQKYAIYASLISLFDSQSSSIPNCPDTIAINSPEFGTLALSEGCSGIKSCPVKYGCKSGACVVVATDDFASCGPWSCASNCSANCATQDPENGTYINECNNF